MMRFLVCSKRFGKRELLLALALVVCAPPAALGASSITGTVRNRSRGEPAAGDAVLLVPLDGGTQVEARVRTDSQGAFTLDAQHPDKPYMVRVLHQGVSYDQQASAGEALSIEVFDSAPEVPGLTGTIEILRTGTNGNFLHVSDMIEIKNTSSPPLTRAGERTFEIYLPPNAKIDSVLAAGPGKIAAIIFAAPAPGQPGHYTVDFPLRPGATKFAFNYNLPYRGHAAFQTKHSYPLQQLAVMIPRALKFRSRSTAFELLATGNTRYHVHAVNKVEAGAGPEFEVSGTETLPPTSQQLSLSPASPIPTQSPPVRALLPTFLRFDSHPKQTQPPSQLPVLVGMTSALLAACAFLIWQGRRARTFSAARTLVPRTRQARRAAA